MKSLCQSNAGSFDGRPDAMIICARLQIIGIQISGTVVLRLSVRKELVYCNLVVATSRRTPQITPFSHAILCYLEYVSGICDRLRLEIEQKTFFLNRVFVAECYYILCVSIFCVDSRSITKTHHISDASLTVLSIDWRYHARNSTSPAPIL